MCEPVDEDEDNEIEEEEINAAVKRVFILLDQVNDLSKSAKYIVKHYCIVYLIFNGSLNKMSLPNMASSISF